MPTILQTLETAFRAAILTAVGFDADPVMSVAQNQKFGDYQSSAAMGLAKKVADVTGQKTNPRVVAERIVSELTLGNLATEISIAGPGFINVRINPNVVADRLQPVLTDDRLGILPVEHPVKTVVDYSGPNIAKQMHVGHLRGTIIGDAIVRVLSFAGHEVIRQNHIGDWGLQMGMVTYALEQQPSAELSLDDLEKMYKTISGASKDKAINTQMAQRTRVLQQTPKSELVGWQKVRALTLGDAHELYRQLGVTLTEADVRGESDYSDDYAGLVQSLQDRGLAKTTDSAVGIFPPGFTNREGEPAPFKILSQNGTYQYPTFDLAALTFRINVLHARRVIYTHDMRQAEHFAMLFAVARMIGLAGDDVSLEYARFGLMQSEGGKAFSSRKGENAKLVDLLEEARDRALVVVSEKNAGLPESQRRDIANSVGVGAIKYADLSKDRTTDYVFSFDRMLALVGDTGPYLQYQYARTQSIFRKAAEKGVAVVRPFVAPIQLTEPAELSLAKHLLRLEDVLRSVAAELKPHYLCAYLYELAGTFSGFFENCPVVTSEDPTRSSRLALCEATGRTLALGLDLLGIDHPAEM